MKNLLRSDFYRLFRSKSFYICTFVAALLMALNIFIIDWSIRVTSTLENAAATMPFAVNPYTNGISYGMIAFTGGDVHMFIAIFTAIFITAEFSHGTMKNAVSKGFHRVQIYSTKMITMTAAAFLMMFVMFVIGTIAATIVTGTLGDISGVLIGQMLKTIGMEFLLHTSLIAIFVMIAMTIKNIGGVIAIDIIGVITLSGLVYLLLEFLFKNTIHFTKYSLINNIKFYYMNTTATGDDYLRSILVGIAFLVVATALGIFAFIKTDVK